MKHGKKYLESAKLIESSKLYDPDEAVKLALQTAKTKFDETMEISVRLGVDPRQADQQVRGAVVLPHGTGKKVRVLVFAKGEQAKAADEAGADYVGAGGAGCEDPGRKLVRLRRRRRDPEHDGRCRPSGRVLGPKGLMPNPKSGTVTMDVAKAISEIKAGKVEYRLDKQAIIHCPDRQEVLHRRAAHGQPDRADERHQPRQAGRGQGHYLRSVVLSSTMGPASRSTRSSSNL